MQMGLRASHLDTTDSVGVTHAVEVGKREAGRGGAPRHAGAPPQLQSDRCQEGTQGGLGDGANPPTSALPAAAGLTGRRAHLFAESELYARLLPALRWWTFGSLVAF